MDVLRVKERRVMQETPPAHAPAVAQFAQKHQCLTLTPNNSAEQTLLTNCISCLSSPHLHPHVTWWVSQFSSENLFRNWQPKMWNPLKFVWGKSYKASTFKEFHNCDSEEPPRINRLDPYSRWLILLISCCNSCKYNPQILCPSEEICKLYNN